MKQLAWTLLAVAALTALSCKKEAAIQDEVVPDAPGEVINPGGSDWSAYDADKFLVSFTGTMEKTKAEIDVTSGVPSWSDGDLVLVYVAESSKSGKYQYDASEGKFYPVDAADIVAPTAGQTVYVYYPWADDLSVSGSTATMTLPAEFNGSSPAPMAGTGTVGDALSGISVPFKNLGAILHVKLTGSDTPTAVELANSNVALAGSASISWEGGIPKLSTSGTSKSVKALTGATAPAEVELCFLLPPSSEAMSDMSLKVIFGKTVGEVTYEPYEVHTRTAALSYARNELRHLTLNVGFFSGGDGSEAHPYQISSKEDFLAIATAVADETAEGPLGFVTDNGTFFGSAGAHYIQRANIDFENAVLSPIGSNSKPFKGIYDGDGKTLSNFSVGTSSSSYVGVFGYLEDGEVNNVSVSGAQLVGTSPVGGIVAYLKNGKVTDCSLANSSVKGDAANIGGIVGRAYSGTVSGCSITGVTVSEYDTSTGNNYGGIVGYVDNVQLTVENCHTDATSLIRNNSNKGQVGGIVGGSGIKNANKLVITNCSNAATITSGTGGTVGGIVGVVQHGEITHCSNTGTITSGGQVAGGIAGKVYGGAEIYACWSNANVSAAEGKNQAGGIVGWLDWGAIVCCHAKGSISGASYVAGIVGRAINGANITDGSSIKNHRVLVHQCLSQADVTSSGATAASGGVIGMLQANKYSQTNSSTGAEEDVMEYAMVEQCAGWKATVKNTATTDCVRFGAFIGYVATNQSGLATNNRCFTENCYTALEDGDLIWTEAGTTLVGGYIGWLNRGNLKNCFYRIPNNTQNATTNKNNKWITNLTQFTDADATDSGFCAKLMSSLQVRTSAMNVANSTGKTYLGSAWTITGKNGETLPFPLPQDLVDLGPEFYQ